MSKKDDLVIRGNSAIWGRNRQKSIFKDIDKATTEKDVEYVYQRGLQEYFNVKVEHPFSCDGYLECVLENDDGKKTKLMLITEYKLDKDFMSKIDRGKVLIQVLYYLKKFESNGRALPNVILVGDKNEVFVMHTNDISEYLDSGVDWNIAPSEAPDRNRDLLISIRGNDEINPFVYQIDSSFNFRSVCDKIKDLSFNVKRHVRVNENNMSTVFDYFSNNVLKDKSKISANEIVHIFMDLMLNPMDAYLHPKKKTTLVLSNGTEVAVNRDSYGSFFNHYAQDYKPSEREKFTEVADRLIEDTERRRKGEFYTPTIWVNEAHKMISDQFGDDWKDEYVVWDCAWGTGNLTRDYKFKELYASTLNKGDIEIGKKYNPNNVKFQYDFLNDDVELFEQLKEIKEKKGYLEESDFKESKLYKVAPQLVRSLLEGKKLLFFINPPYGTSGDISIVEGGTKKGIAVNNINKLMVENQMGKGSRELYAQFLFRLSLLSELLLFDLNICLITKMSLFTGAYYATLRTYLHTKVCFVDGFMLNASEFADVSSAWGITFSVLGSIKQFESLSVHYPFKVLSSVDDSIDTSGVKCLEVIDAELKASRWVRDTIKGLTKTKNVYYSKSALNPYHKDGYTGVVEGSIGSAFLKSNNVGKNDLFIALGTAMYGDTANFSILRDNIYIVLSYFTARRLITGQYANWVNDKDEYMIPSTDYELYPQWEKDCIVYSLFNTASNQSSLRQIDYKDKKWDIKNEFFFMSTQDIRELADDNNNDEVYQDIKEHGEERYVYKLLQDVELSEDAQQVLNKAIELTKESFKYREMFNEDHPEYHINSWDAGWYQIKGILKEYMPEELKEFSGLYKALGDRMRPLVYELGFLKE